MGHCYTTANCILKRESIYSPLFFFIRKVKPKERPLRCQSKVTREKKQKTSPHPYYPQLSLHMHTYWDTPKWDTLLGQLLGGTTGIRSIHSSLIRLCLIFTLSFKKVCFAVQIPRKLDICMKTKNIILSDKNDSSILDRQVRDCPDVSEKTVPQRIPRRYREDMKGLQERYDLHEGLVINVSLKEFRGICERDYPKIEAYLGLKKYLLCTFGVTLNIHSQKTKGDLDKDKNTAITQK